MGQYYLVTRFVLSIPHKARTMKEGPFKGKGLVGNLDLAELTLVCFVERFKHIAAVNGFCISG